jgi:uncharacterized membrane protein
MNPLPPVYYIVFTAITAAAVLLQALVLLALFLAVRKAMSKLLTVTDEVKEQALPLLASARSLVEDVSPKLKVASGNLVDVSHTLRQQANHVNDTVSVLLDKTNAQLSRVDEMISGTLNAVDHATRTIESAVSTPVRRVSGLLHGLKTGVEVFITKKKPAAPESAAESVKASEAKPA